jgi:hypothetical protein
MRSLVGIARSMRVTEGDPAPYARVIIPISGLAQRLASSTRMTSSRITAAPSCRPHRNGDLPALEGALPLLELALPLGDHVVGQGRLPGLDGRT